jgi:hypothetical protein
MVISDTHRYVFVELPHTASTAISAELCANYDGRKILRKHARYHEFLKWANADQRNYFVFSGVRNPLDETVSIYFKLLGNHKGNFSDPDRFADNGGWISDGKLHRYEYLRETSADFPAYFMRFFQAPYDNWSNLAHKSFDFVYRFESVVEDFDRILAAIGIQQDRPLPMLNKTSGRESHYLDYYVPEIRSRAIEVFGPFLRKWAYRFPADWGSVSVPVRSLARFELNRALQRWQLN